MTKREREARAFIREVAANGFPTYELDMQVLAAGLLAGLRACSRTQRHWPPAPGVTVEAAIRDAILSALEKAGADLGGGK